MQANFFDLHYKYTYQKKFARTYREEVIHPFRGVNLLSVSTVYFHQWVKIYQSLGVLPLFSENIALTSWIWEGIIESGFLLATRKLYSFIEAGKAANDGSV